MRVAIAIPAFDAAGSVAAVVAAALEQLPDVLVIDDGSRDRSVAAVRAFPDARIQIHADGKQLGLAARLNQAIEFARTLRPIDPRLAFVDFRRIDDAFMVLRLFHGLATFEGPKC